MDNLRDSHRMFLQSLLSKHVLIAEDVYKVLKACCDRFEGGLNEENKNELLVDFCNQLNNNIRPFGMEIKKAIGEHDGRSYYGLVNTTENSISTCQSHYTDDELEFFKKLIEEIVKSDTGTIGTIAALALCDTLQKKMSKSDAEHLLDNLESEKWIGKDNSGRVYLGVRGLMELDQYIFEAYEDYVVRCNMCKQLCLQGQGCQNCDTRLHDHCARRFFKHQTEQKCPECHVQWKVPISGKDPSTSAPRKHKASP